MEKRERAVQILGWAGTAMALVLWISFADQIRLNLGGQKGSWVLALAAVVNCSLWCSYALLKQPRLWPVFWANILGIPFGLAAAITSL